MSVRKLSAAMVVLLILAACVPIPTTPPPTAITAPTATVTSAPQPSPTPTPTETPTRTPTPTETPTPTSTPSPTATPEEVAQATPIPTEPPVEPTTPVEQPEIPIGSSVTLPAGITLYSAPGVEWTTLNQGVAVTVAEVQGDWVKVVNDEGTECWVPISVIEGQTPSEPVPPAEPQPGGVLPTGPYQGIRNHWKTTGGSMRFYDSGISEIEKFVQRYRPDAGNEYWIVRGPITEINVQEGWIKVSTAHGEVFVYPSNSTICRTFDMDQNVDFITGATYGLGGFFEDNDLVSFIGPQPRYEDGCFCQLKKVPLDDRK